MVLEEWCKSRHGTSTWDWIDRSQMGWLLVEMRERWQSSYMAFRPVQEIHKMRIEDES
jgi:hypothetical protein